MDVHGLQNQTDIILKTENKIEKKQDPEQGEAGIGKWFGHQSFLIQLPACKADSNIFL